VKRAGYRAGVAWIAVNDEPTDRDAESIAGYVSTLLLADLFEIEPARVAADVLRAREKGEEPQSTAMDLDSISHVVGTGRRAHGTAHLTDLNQWTEYVNAAGQRTGRWHGPTLCGLWESRSGDPRRYRSTFPKEHTQCRRCRRRAGLPPRAA
jgi:hypothetical protein